MDWESVSDARFRGAVKMGGRVGQNLLHTGRCPVPNVLTASGLPFSNAAPVSKSGIDIVGLHAGQGLRLAKIVALARCDAANGIQIQRLVRHLDPADRTQDGPAHIVIDHHGLRRGHHDRAKHAHRQVYHVCPGMRRQGDGIAFLITCLRVGDFCVGHPGGNGRGQADMCQQLRSRRAGHGTFATPA